MENSIIFISLKVASGSLLTILTRAILVISLWFAENMLRFSLYSLEMNSSSWYNPLNSEMVAVSLMNPRRTLRKENAHPKQPENSSLSLSYPLASESI